MGYRWCSYRVNAGLRIRRRLVEHDIYRCLRIDNDSRYQAYRDLFLIDLSQKLVNAIRRSASFSMPLGGHRFQQQVEDALGRKLGQAKRGRPHKVIENN